MLQMSQIDTSIFSWLKEKLSKLKVKLTESETIEHLYVPLLYDWLDMSSGQRSECLSEIWTQSVMEQLRKKQPRKEQPRKKY